MRWRDRGRSERLLRGAILGCGLAVAWRATGLLPAGAAGAALLATTAALFPLRPGAGWRARLAENLLARPLLLHAVAALFASAAAVWAVGFAAAAVGGSAGLAFGLALAFAAEIRRPALRTVALVGLGAGLFAAGWVAQQWFGAAPRHAPAFHLALALLGVALLALLFAGSVDGDLEIGLAAAALSLGAAGLLPAGLPQFVAFIGPVALYVAYSERLRGQWTAAKHTLRGLIAEERGDTPRALAEFRSAEAAAPATAWAQAGSRRAHRKVALAALAGDASLAALIDPRECLARARRTLADLRAEPAALDDAEALLRLVETRRDDIRWTVLRERLRLALARADGAAALELVRAALPLPPAAAWALPDHEAEAHAEVWSRWLRDPALASAGLEALAEPAWRHAGLAAFNRRLKQTPEDAVAAAFATQLTRRLVADEVRAHAEATDDPLEWIDPAACYTAGVQACSAPQRDDDIAAELLEIASWSAGDRRPTVWAILRDVDQRRGRADADQWLRQTLEWAGDRHGAALPAAGREDYFAACQTLGAQARAHGELRTALDCYARLAQSPRAGLGVQRILMELHEAHGAPLAALRTVAGAFQHDIPSAERPAWEADRRRLYLALALKPPGPGVPLGPWWDAAACALEGLARRAAGAAEAELAGWATLAELGPQPATLLAACLRGELAADAGRWEVAAREWEVARAVAPRNEEERRRRRQALRNLAAAWLERLGNPRQALAPLHDLEKDLGSGADTMLSLGRAYEAAGEMPAARKWYELTLVYPDHPAAERARAALRRMPGAS